jgi:glycosyltransferase involved in cell wall biosynthesis
VNSPLVTIVTPSYNQGRFIRATIESVLAQDYPRIEYIIMDGGSTDETAAVVGEYTGRLQWYSEKDKGQSHAINKGFRMAKGEVVSWLNSDDVILPGAVSHAVRAFEQNPSLGAVYGEGYQIDINGGVRMRFKATEPFNLWKLIYVWDYILQQTSYFRRSIFDEIGYINEELQYGMDWDLLIRIGKRYPIGYIPELMGCIREYSDAKSFSGGRKRFRELATLMRRHTGVRYPPGYIIYGLDTYSAICCDCLRSWTPRRLEGLSSLVRRAVRGVADLIILRTAETAQGWYPDGWASPNVRYMLGPGSGTVAVRGSWPHFGRGSRKQVLAIRCGGIETASFALPNGDFHFAFDIPAAYAGRLVDLQIRASRWFIPGLRGFSKDFRRLAYILKSISWVQGAAHGAPTR